MLRRECAATKIQSTWRMWVLRVAHLRTVRLHRAATVLQSVWKMRKAQHKFKQTLPFHRAATVLQRSWRRIHTGSRKREALRSAFLQAWQLHKASIVIQSMWRRQVAAFELQRLVRAERTRRFQESIKVFAQANDSPPPRPASGAGAKANPHQWNHGIGGTPRRSTNDASQNFISILIIWGPASGAGAKANQWNHGIGGTPRRSTNDASENDQRPVSRGASRPSCLPPSPATPMFSTSDLRKSIVRGDLSVYKDKSQRMQDRLQSLHDFKLSPLLQFWQGKSDGGAHPPGASAGYAIHEEGSDGVSPVDSSAGQQEGADGRGLSPRCDLKELARECGTTAQLGLEFD
eukprot:gene16612-22854_t